MTSKLTASLRRAPATVPAFVAMVLFVLWATDQAGYPVTHWAPGALILLVLLGIALALIRLSLADVPVPVRIALGCLALYTLLSFLSILWAAVPGDAWDGANRTLLYLLVFALFACWRQRGPSAGLLLGCWTLALIALAAFAALHIDAASSARLQLLLPGGRLSYPTGYPNANAAQWLIAFWPALLLARSERLPWGLRGLLAGGAVLLAEVALLSQSRGSLYATPVVLLLVFALLPDRRRTFALLVPVGLAIAAAAPTVLKVGNHLHNGNVVRATLHSAVTASFLAALAAGLLVALGAAIEARGSFSEASQKRIRTSVGATGIAALVLAILAILIVAGNPITRIEHGWNSFKGGYSSENTGGSRLVSGLGSNRYDFYRVALDEFLAHPIVGIGADNFQQQYLAHGRSRETPHYPHSVELRTLTQTGLIGTLLALLGLGAALLAVSRALRKGADPLARAVAAAALAGFGYWVVHGSFDWFWEFAGLGAPAFALLGIACSLASNDSEPGSMPSNDPEPGSVPIRAPESESVSVPAPGRRPSPRPLGRRLAFAAIGLLMALVAAASLTVPWLGELQIQSALRVWTREPETAYIRLHRAARLNHLSDQAYLLTGSIALRYGELSRADRAFSSALARTPGDAYATLEQGAIASTRGQRSLALELLQRAVRLEPRDELARQALQTVQQGHRVSIEELNRLILREAEQLA